MPNINYEIPEELHRRCKTKAAEKRMYLRDFVIAALSDAVEETDDKHKAIRRKVAHRD